MTTATDETPDDGLPKLYGAPACLTCGIDLHGDSLGEHMRQHARLRQSWILRTIHGEEAVIPVPRKVE